MAHILIAEDDVTICSFLVAALEAEGHVVRHAPNGNIAFRLLNEEPADLVISDILMPESDGLELLTNIRKHHPGTKVILASAGGKVASSTYLEMGEVLGASASIQKPFKYPDFLDLVNRVLEDPAPPPANN